MAFRGKRQPNWQNQKPLSTYTKNQLQLLGIVINPLAGYSDGLTTQKFIGLYNFDFVDIYMQAELLIHWLAQDSDELKEFFHLRNMFYTAQKDEDYEAICFLVDTAKQLAAELATRILPSDFLERHQTPDVFLTVVAPTIGQYMLTRAEEDYNMLNPYQEEDEPQELEPEKLFPQHTPIEDKLGARQDFPAEIHYPSVKSTRKFNRRQAIASKARLCARLYNRLFVRLPHMSAKQKQEAAAYFKKLCPSMWNLKKFYRSRGYTSIEVNLIVTPGNYPYLQNVWLTKRQQRFLLEALDGQTEDAFVTNGFK